MQLVPAHDGRHLARSLSIGRGTGPHNRSHSCPATGRTAAAALFVRQLSSSRCASCVGWAEPGCRAAAELPDVASDRALAPWAQAIFSQTKLLISADLRRVSQLQELDLYTTVGLVVQDAVRLPPSLTRLTLQRMASLPRQVR